MKKLDLFTDYTKGSFEIVCALVEQIYVNIKPISMCSTQYSTVDHLKRHAQFVLLPKKRHCNYFTECKMYDEIAEFLQN